MNVYELIRILDGVLCVNAFGSCVMLSVCCEFYDGAIDMCDRVLYKIDKIKSTQGKIFHAFVVVPPVIVWLIPSMVIQLIYRAIKDLYRE